MGENSDLTFDLFGDGRSEGRVAGAKVHVDGAGNLPAPPVLTHAEIAGSNEGGVDSAVFPKADIDAGTRGPAVTLSARSLDAGRLPPDRPDTPPLPVGGSQDLLQNEAYEAEVAARQKARRERNRQAKKEEKRKRDATNAADEVRARDRKRPALPPVVLSTSEVAQICGKSKPTIYRWVDEVPDFPKPFRLGKSNKFLADEIYDYIRKQAEARK